jgi:hypothetical protein
LAVNLNSEFLGYIAHLIWTHLETFECQSLNYSVGWRCAEVWKRGAAGKSPAEAGLVVGKTRNAQS